jgi:deoxyribose-phosphate aldolase
MTTDVELLSEKARRQAAQVEAGLAPPPANHGSPGVIEWVQLTPAISPEKLRDVCEEAKSMGYGALCLPSPWVRKAADLLSGTEARLTVPIGFPLGTAPQEAVMLEARAALAEGAGGINAVFPVHRLRSPQKTCLRQEMENLREATRGARLSFYLETAVMNDEEIVSAVRLAEIARADGVIGGTGCFGFPSVREVALLKCAAPDWMEVGVAIDTAVKSRDRAALFLAAGAGRLLSENPGPFFGQHRPPGGPGCLDTEESI